MDDGYDSCEPYDSDDALSEGDIDFLSDGHEEAKSIQLAPATWTVIDAAGLAQAQEEALKSVTGILGCSRSTARTMLIHFRWNTETLFGVLAERGKECVYRMSGITSRSTEPPTPSGACGNTGELTCGTCFCDVPATEATTMECGHAFCNDCWRQHLVIQIEDGRARRLPCMGVRCGAICEESKVRALIGAEPEALAKYKRCLMESYVDDNAQVRWCPSVPHCGRAVRAEGEPHCEPECACGLRFCFACGEEPHSPCTCEMWRRWKQKCQDDSETKNWLTANTKACPKCSKPVEKNGGCNLVVCMCGQAFCWLCGEGTGMDHTWSNITGHSCGRFKEDLDKRIGEAQRSVKRYAHYHLRWEAHVKSGALEAALRGKVAANIAVLEQSQSLLRDYSWLLQALEQLFNARRILGYSYAFAFYMFGQEMFGDEVSPEQNAINQNLFEDQQQQLESEVERLSMMVEASPEALGAVEAGARLAAINSAVNVDKRLLKLYDLIENDLLGRLQLSISYIAPYKNQSTVRMGGAPALAPNDASTSSGSGEASGEPAPSPAATATPSQDRGRPRPAARLQQLHVRQPAPGSPPKRARLATARVRPAA